MSANRDCQQDCMGATATVSAPSLPAAGGACGVQPQVLAESPPMALKAAIDPSGSSSSSMQLAAHQLQGSCAANLDDEDGDASTTASTSEPPPESPRVRWADLAAWDEEEEEALLPPQALDSACAADKPCSVLKPPMALADGPQPPSAMRTKWADLADSDDEQLPQYLLSTPSVQPEAAAAAAAAAATEITPSGRRHSGNSRLKAAKNGGTIPIAATTDEGTGGELTKLSGTNAAAAAADSHAAPAARRQQRWVAVSRNADQAEPSSDAVTWPAWSEQQQQHKQKQKVAPTAARETAEKDGDKKRRQSWNQRSGKPKPGAKHQCQFLVGIEEEPTFQVKRRLLGPHGQHMKAIAEASGAKLRLRGRGSGFLEGVEQEESADPLMLCVSAPDAAAYKYAVKLTRELLDGIHGDFRRFYSDVGSAVPSLVLHMHEGPRPGSR